MTEVSIFQGNWVKSRLFFIPITNRTISSQNYPIEKLFTNLESSEYINMLINFKFLIEFDKKFDYKKFLQFFGYYDTTSINTTLTDTIILRLYNGCSYI